MARKNPENKPLRIVRDPGLSVPSRFYVDALSRLAIAESNLVKAGKSSALPHFIAVVKELERVLGFKFEIVEDDEGSV